MSLLSAGRTIRISDHALCRYLERAKGMDLDAIRTEIAEQVKPYTDIRCKRVRKDTFVFCLDYIENTAMVTTVMPRTGVAPNMRGRTIRLPLDRGGIAARKQEAGR